MLGIAIGTASVILFVTISIGSRQGMNKSLEYKPLDLITTNIFSQNKKMTEGDVLKIKGTSDYEKKKISIERALINDLEITIVDEPVESLDEEEVKYIMGK